MKKKSSKLLWFVLILLIIFSIMIYFYLKPVSNNSTDTSSNIREATVGTGTIEKTITGSGEISTSLTEKLELNTYRYLSEVLVKAKQFVAKGEKILKYTNGTYLYAPYDLVVTNINVGEEGEICRSTHFIEVASTNNLTLTLDIDEADLGSVKVNQEVDITVNAVTDKTYTGKITEIEEIGAYASNGSKFKAIISFENDGNVKIGMSASCVVTIDKAENVIVVPVAAVQRQGSNKYVVVINADGTTKNVNVETGLSNDAYVEIKSGLSGGEKIQMIVSSSSSSSSRFQSAVGITPIM